jgi:hypothetical protein
MDNQSVISVESGVKDIENSINEFIEKEASMFQMILNSKNNTKRDWTSIITQNIKEDNSINKEIRADFDNKKNLKHFEKKKQKCKLYGPVNRYWVITIVLFILSLLIVIAIKSFSNN